MNSRDRWSRTLVIVGSALMLVGAIDPMEGSLLTLPGSGLAAVGGLIGHGEKRHVAYKIWVFVLIAFGVGALWGMSMVGGFGGKSGHSMWWGLLLVPYLVGWSMAMWGPATPRWVPAGGIVISLWYLVIPALILLRARSNPQRPVIPAVLIAIGLCALLTIAGCIFRLRQPVVQQRPGATPG
jgi:hypothetical protein